MSERMTKPFPITSVCRADCAEIIGEEKAKALTDEQMFILARKMADDYINQLFWEHLGATLDYIMELEHEQTRIQNCTAKQA